MKLCIISDTHNLHDNIILPEGDVLIHCGDFSNRGSLLELYKFASWMKNQPHTYKISIAGNHDRCFENSNSIEAKNTMREFGINYLFDDSIIIDNIKFYGSPWSKYFYDWSFNLQPGREIAEKWKLIPNDTNVLILHQPPFGILDLIEEDWGETNHGGCKDLKARIDNLNQLKLICYGHYHLQGCSSAKLNDKIFVNAAMCDDKHQINRMPITIEL